MRDNRPSIERDRTRKHIARVALAAVALAGLLALAPPAAAQSTKDHDNGGGDPWPFVPPIARILLSQDPVGRVVLWIADGYAAGSFQGYRR